MKGKKPVKDPQPKSGGGPLLTRSKAAAERAGFLYIQQLRLEARKNDGSGIRGTHARALVSIGRYQPCAILSLKTQAEQTIWIWSDLHLGNEEKLDRLNRPFPNTDAMNEAIFSAWKGLVGPDDLMIIAGDVGVQGGVPAGLRQAWTALPGRKCLVPGEQDINTMGSIDNSAYDRVCIAILIPGRPGAPDIAVTHLPMVCVPAATVNVHGHGPPEGRENHGSRVQITADELDFKPLGMGLVLEKAQALHEQERAERRNRRRG